MAADWLNIAGGAAKGYVQGDEDNQRRAEFRALQKQRERLEKTQKEDDEQAAQLKGVRPAGEYMDPQGYEAASDFQGPVPEDRKKKVKVTESDADRARANIIASRGRPEDLARSAALRTQAYQSQQMADQQKQREGFNALRQAKMMSAKGDHVGATRLLQKAYMQEPDGQDITIEEKDGVLHSGVAAAGKYIPDFPSEPISAESVQKLIDNGYAMLNPETYAKSQELGIQKTTAGAHVMSAEAAKKNAESAAAKSTWETTGPGGQAHLKYLEDQGVYLGQHGKALIMEAQARVAANKKQTPGEKAQELIDTYTPIIQAANPGMPLAQVRMLAARSVTPHDPTKTANDQLTGSDIVKIQGKYYQNGPDGKLKELRLPGDLNKIAGNMAASLGATDDGRPSATEPTSTFRSVPTPGVGPTRGSPQAVAISPREINDWVPQLTGSGRKYTNPRTGEVISQEEFERRTAP